MSPSRTKKLVLTLRFEQKSVSNLTFLCVREIIECYLIFVNSIFLGGRRFVLLRDLPSKPILHFDFVHPDFGRFVGSCRISSQTTALFVRFSTSRISQLYTLAELEHLTISRTTHHFQKDKSIIFQSSANHCVLFS